MLPLTEYTDTDAVRAVVGVTDNEVPDLMLTQQGLTLSLTLDLGEWLPSHATIYAEGNAQSPTESQLQKWRYLQLYSQFYCATSLVEFMQLAVPQMIGDGKDEMRRFTNFDFDKLLAKFKAAVARYRTRLLEASGTAADTAPPSLLGAAVPDYDPVAGP